MGNVSAEVQVLTAEVRVLMVGSRQVTLSVFRQLDRVERGQCTPFGRVRDKDEGRLTIEVVGADDAGNLVRSKTVSPTPHVYFKLGDKLHEELSEHIDVEGWSPGRVLYASGFYVRIASQYDDHPTLHSRDEFNNEVGYEYDEYKKDREFWDAWKALPLIVLAGLK